MVLPVSSNGAFATGRVPICLRQIARHHFLDELGKRPLRRPAKYLACLAGITDEAVRAGARSLSRMLEQAGEAEWELVSAAPLGQGGVGVLFFKRPKAEG